MRVVIVFDNSGSMRQSDPARLSRTAAQLFLDLVRPQDAVGLVAFSDTATPLVPLTPFTRSTTRERVRAQLRSLKFTGQTTDLASALEAGLASFPPTRGEGQRDLVLLLTDGKLDLGPQRRAEEPAVLEHIRQYLLPTYRQRGIALYTIAFTEGADQDLLREMAQASAGEFRFIKSATVLHKAFLQLFVLANQAEEVPFAHGAFLLDPSIHNVSLVLPKHDPQEQIALRTPQQALLHARNTSPGMTWNVTPTYDLVHLIDPEPGLWHVEQLSGMQEGAAIVGMSTLRLDVELHPAYREVGEPMSLRATVLENGQRLQDAQQVQQLTFQAEVTSPQGERWTLPLALQREGIFATTLPPLQVPGQYTLVMTTTGPTLRRQYTLPFTVHPPCFQPALVQNAPVTVQVMLANSCPPFQTLTLEAEHSIADRRTERIPPTLHQPGVFAATLPPLTPGQTGQVTLHIHGRPEGAEAFILVKGPWSVAAPPLPPPEPHRPAPPGSQPRAPDSGAAIMPIIRVLLVFNVVLACIVGGGYGLYRYYIWRRKATNG